MSIDVSPWPVGEVERLEAWLEAPHVARWWKSAWGGPVVAALRGGAPVPHRIRPWRIDLDGRPIGYAQDCDPADDGDAWKAEEGVGPGTRRVYLLFGEPDALNRKLGRVAIRALTARLFSEPAIDRLIAAPHPDNWPCIIAFKRAGFRERGRRQLADGPVMLLTAAKTVWRG